MQVPYRCLVPQDSVSFIIGKGGATIRQMSESSGAALSISKDTETPKTLGDKIVTIAGINSAKEAACREVVRKLRKMQGVEDFLEPGVFVIIIPEMSAPVVVGAKGAQIKSIMEQSGAEINIGREAIIGMPDLPVSINGTVEQVVSAVSRINAVLQDMLDRGKLLERDFQFQIVGPDGEPNGSGSEPAEPSRLSDRASADHQRNGSVRDHGPNDPNLASSLGGSGPPSQLSKGISGGPGSQAAMAPSVSNINCLGMPAMPALQGSGGSENAFLSALQASGINSAQLTVLLPRDLVHHVLIPRGFMKDIAQRSGSRIDIGDEGPSGLIQVSLNGQMVGNALAALLLQEKAASWQAN
mmetsp:Transcript_3135/g.7302  ORF Transcript_3135/g.7302 Transcript_3135/m.7302 type:complete len:355 (-) Transcript_3135:23-1087(-)